MVDEVRAPADIEAVVNLHCEGSSALPSLTSAWRAVSHARMRGINTVLSIVLDSADHATQELASTWAERFDAQIISTEAADLGAARNAAVANSTSAWMAFLDGDDLWSENWLAEAYDVGTQTPDDVPCAVHPQLNIIFGDHHSLLHHIDSTDPQFRWSRFSLQNMWTALCVVRREVLVELPYPENDLAHGFGFEDWSWNMALLDSGGRHLVVPETCHFIRRTHAPSLLSSSQRALRSDHPAVAPGRRTVAPWPTGTPTADTGTHQDARVSVSDTVKEQIRLASTIEPQVSKTLPLRGSPPVVPQNFNTHNTDAQLALEELWSLRSETSSSAEICDRSPLLAQLHPDQRAFVTAEFIRIESAHGRTLGASKLIDEATEQFPQLASLL